LFRKPGDHLEKSVTFLVSLRRSANVPQKKLTTSGPEKERRLEVAVNSLGKTRRVRVKNAPSKPGNRYKLEKRERPCESQGEKKEGVGGGKKRKGVGGIRGGASPTMKEGQSLISRGKYREPRWRALRAEEKEKKRCAPPRQLDSLENNNTEKRRWMRGPRGGYGKER